MRAWRWRGSKNHPSSMRWFFCFTFQQAHFLAKAPPLRDPVEKARICSIRRRRAWFVMLLHACRRVDSVMRAAQGGAAAAACAQKVS